MSTARRPTVNPYTWRNGPRSARGVLIQAGPARIFVPTADAYSLADAIVDAAETIEKEN